MSGPTLRCETSALPHIDGALSTGTTQTVEARAAAAKARKQAARAVRKAKAAAAKANADSAHKQSVHNEAEGRVGQAFGKFARYQFERIF